MKKIVFLAPALLLAGCRGEQVAFQFQPASATSVALAPSVAAASSTTTLPTPVTAVAPAPVAALPLPARPMRPRRLAAALKALPPTALATLAAPTRAGRQLSQHLGRRHATEGAAESGLGRVALFFIAVALGLVAGLAALFALIPGVSFFGGVGLAVGALVVLFLLYSLVSGGKKKKA
ncbi:MAG: hypothetical protein ACRYG7_28860 [Janthinobacterium lividum]